jgi:hypothetical protein
VVALMEVPHWSVFEFGDMNFLELWLKSSSLIALLIVSRLGSRKLVFTPKTVLLFKEVHWFLESRDFPGGSPLSLYSKLC